MKTLVFPQIERNVAKCRIILSLIALIAMFVDPTKPFLRPATTATGWFAIDPIVLLAMGSHLLYSVVLYYATTMAFVPLATLIVVSTWGDVLMAVVIAVVTEGVSSPFFPFFVFAVVQVGLRANVRQTIAVTAISVALYLILILVSTAGWLFTSAIRASFADLLAVASEGDATVSYPQLSRGAGGVPYAQRASSIS